MTDAERIEKIERGVEEEFSRATSRAVKLFPEDFRFLLAQAREAGRLRAAIPRTEDGETILPEMQLWNVHHEGIVPINVTYVSRHGVCYSNRRFPNVPFEFDSRHHEHSRVYSSREAALAAATSPPGKAGEQNRRPHE